MIKQRSIKDSSTFWLIVAVIIMTGLIYTRDLIGIGVNKYILVVVAVISALKMNYSSLVYFIFFLFPIVSGIPDNYIFPMLAAILLLKKPDAFAQKAMYCFFIIVFFELAHYAFYSFDIRIPNVIGYFSTIFFLCYFSVLKDSEIQNRLCLMYFCIGLLVFLFGVLYITQVHGGVNMLLESSQRIGETRTFTDADAETMMLGMNSNSLGYFSIVGLALLFVLYYFNKLRFVSLFIMSVVYVYVGALSVSRTWLIGVVLLVVLLMIMMRRVHSSNNGFRYFLLIVLAMIGGYALFQNEQIYEAFFNRMTDSSVSSANGRVEAMQLYNQALIDNVSYLLFGVGAVHYTSVLSDICLAVHNGVQQILVSYGIVGVVFFFFITVKAFMKNYRKGYLLCSLPFLLSFFYVQSGQLLYPHYNLYPFIVSFVALRLIDDNYDDNRTAKAYRQ